MGSRNDWRHYAAGTKVSATKTQGEIVAMLERWGVGSVATSVLKGARDAGEPVRRWRCDFAWHGRFVRLELETGDLDAQGEREQFRCLLLLVKAELHAIYAGLKAEEDAFLLNQLVPVEDEHGVVEVRPVCDLVGRQVELAYERGGALHGKTLLELPNRTDPKP